MNKSRLQKRKLARRRYKLRSTKESGLSLRSRTLPPRSLSNLQRKINRKKTRRVATRSATTSESTATATATTATATATTTEVATEVATETVEGTVEGTVEEVVEESATTTTATTATATTAAEATSTDRDNSSRFRWVDFNWHLHPHAWACFLQTPYKVLPPNTETENAVPIRVELTVHYIDRGVIGERRGAFIVGSDPSCDLVFQGTNVEPRHCLIYTQINADHQSGRSFLKPILSNIGSKPIYISCVSRGFHNKLLPQRSMVLRPKYVLRFTRDTRETEAQMIFCMKILPVPSFEESYSLGELIGTGNFAEVNVATDKNTGEVVAVKTIKISEFRRTTDTLSQFSKEVGTVLSLKEHPGVVQIRNIFEEFGFYYIAMEYAPRGELYNFIQTAGYLSETTTRIIFHQLFHIIKFLHSKNIVHRDIKPENILLTNDNTLQVKLCDFGLSTLHCTNMVLLTVCGTVVYVAPEILTRNPEDGYGKSCDLWSLGVVLYTCLHGRPPFFGNDVRDEAGTLDMVRRGVFHFTEVGKSGKEVSDEAKSLISQLLTVNTAERISVDDALKHPWMLLEREKTRTEILKIDKRYWPDEDGMEAE